MANYKVASENEAIDIGSIGTATDKLMVTKSRAISLGCTIRPSTNYTDKQLIALKDLQKVVTETCSCNTGVCTCYGYDSGCSDCYTHTSCPCNAGKCSCNGYSSGCTGQCYSDSTCTCNTGVCDCHGYKSGCSDCHTHTSCPCNTGKCSCNGYDAGTSECYSQNPVGGTCSCVGVCGSQCENCVCESQCLPYGCDGADAEGFPCICYDQCASNVSGTVTCTSDSTYACTCNTGKCSCYGYNAGCSGECYSDSVCSCNLGVCSCHGEVIGCDDCHAHKSCPCNSGKCGCHGYSRGCSGECYSDSTCTCNSGVCACNGHDAGCTRKCHTHNSCSCDTVCDKDCPTNYG